MILPLELPAWSPLQRFLAGIPLFGASVSRAVRDQLGARSGDYLELWETTDVDVDLHLAFRVAAIIKNEQGFPNDFFIPNDPCALLFVDDVDALTPNFIASEIERQLNVRISEDVWKAIETSTFAAFIRALGESRG